MVAGLCLYGMSLFHQQSEQAAHHTPFFTGNLPPAAQQVAAGPFQGVAADLNLLGAFSIYDVIREHELTNNQTDNALWQKLHARLVSAQAMDPWFWDTYRLTVGLMAFHKQGTAAAVDLLSRGATARTWDWEMPFMAGFLAHDMLHDDKRAYELMSEAVKRPNAPPLAVGLASQFLNSAEGSEASMRFLRYLKSTLPAAYRDVIIARIARLQQEKKKAVQP